MSMSRLSTYTPAGGRLEESPLDRPQVPKAEMTSNITSLRSAPLIMTRVAAPIHTMVALITSTEIAMRRDDSGIVRLNATTFWSPRASARMDRAITAMVVTFTPPAVEPEPPPMNMSTSVRRVETGVMVSISTRLKPPERIITEAKMAFRILSPEE